MRDRLLLGSAFTLLLAGIVAWWLLPGRVPSDAGGLASMLALWFSSLGLAAAVWRRTTVPRADESLLLAPIALAATAPLCVVPLLSAASAGVVAAGLAAAAVAVLPLGLTLAARVSDDRQASRLRRLAPGAVIAAAVLSSLSAIEGATPGLLMLRWLAVAAALLIPAMSAVMSALRDARAGLGQQSRIVIALSLGATGAVPAVAAIATASSAWLSLIVPVLAVAATALLLARFVVRPLARLAGRAIAQRDLAVSAAEAERTRLASALHDGPLGDISLLIQRLDAASDLESATLARSIATDLRTIGSDLRLPILDDLGAGPALEWLVGRVAHQAKAEITIEVETARRPPAAVELAVYRVAQEALVNAIKHGRPPVAVRYVADGDAVSLSVDDTGGGLAPDARDRAHREGRLGLVSMSQRAESIGADLVLAASPHGGTRVALRWQPVNA